MSPWAGGADTWLTDSLALSPNRAVQLFGVGGRPPVLPVGRDGLDQGG